MRDFTQAETNLIQDTLHPDSYFIDEGHVYHFAGDKLSVHPDGFEVYEFDRNTARVHSNLVCALADLECIGA